MKKWVFVSLFVGLLGSVGITTVSAITLGFAPSNQAILVGESTSVDIIISGLGGEIVSAYDLDVSYDTSVLSATGVSFGSELLFSFQDFDLTTTPGIINLAELSLFDDLTLSFSQPDSFVLASLQFDGIGVGSSGLSFMSGSFGIDVKGLNAAVLDLDVESGNLQVVPEPSTYILLGTGLIGLALLRRKQLIAEKEQA